MKRLITSTVLVLLLCISIHAQAIDSGSTGADGPFNPPGQVPAGTQVQGTCTAAPGCTATVPLPPNGVFNFTTVTVGPFVTVKFIRNAANTPVFILATGDVRVNGTIDVSGQNALSRSFTAAQGGPGGSSGGLGGIPGSPTGIGGAGNGPGGGVGAGGFGGGEGGAFGENGDLGTPMYGIPELLPLIGGSGGGAGSSAAGVPGGNGGGGGGALLIASSTIIDVGSGSGNAIVANGGAGETVPISPSSQGGSGSGGAIRLVATRLLGNRSLVALGGGCNFSCGRRGRIRLESARPPEYTGHTDPQAIFNQPGEPILIFPPTAPTLRIVSIAGMSLPAQPTFDVGTPDITLPTNFTNPVSIVLEATNVPSGTQARVFVGPQLGNGARTITAPVTLTGTAGQPKRGMVNVTLPTRGVGVISAVIDSVVPEP